MSQPAVVRSPATRNRRDREQSFPAGVDCGDDELVEVLGLAVRADLFRRDRSAELALDGQHNLDDRQRIYLDVLQRGLGLNLFTWNPQIFSHKKQKTKQKKKIKKIFH